MFNLSEFMGIEEERIFCIGDVEYKIINNALMHLPFVDGEWQRSAIGINWLLGHKDEVKILEKHNFTKDEIVILKNIENYHYLARDKDGTFYIYNDKPRKDRGVWEGDDACLFNMYNHLFPDVMWENEEPVHIKNYLNKE